MRLGLLDKKRFKYPGGGGTPCNGLYREAHPKGVSFSGFKYMKGKGFH